MVMTTDVAVEPCPGVLLVTPMDGVLCILPANHTQHYRPGAVVNDEPTYHQGVHGGRIYVWRDYDAGTIRTLRGAGFHDQCDHHAAKLAVIVTPEVGSVTYEVTP